MNDPVSWKYLGRIRDSWQESEPCLQLRILCQDRQSSQPTGQEILKSDKNEKRWEVSMGVKNKNDAERNDTLAKEDHVMSLTEGTKFRRVIRKCGSAVPKFFLLKMSRTHTGALKAGTQPRAFQWSPREKRGPKIHTKVPNPYLAGTQGKEGRGSR